MQGAELIRAYYDAMRGADACAMAELDFNALHASRTKAQVANDRDWPAQLVPSLRQTVVD